MAEEDFVSSPGSQEHTDPETARLLESLRDERARRLFAEREAEAAREKAAIWRQRAEERAQQLRERTSRSTWKRLRRRKSPGRTPTAPREPSKSNDESTTSDSTVPAVPAGITPTYPMVRAGRLASGGVLAEIAAQVDSFPLDSATEQEILTADVLLVRASDLAGATRQLGDLIRRCCTVVGRPPIVLDVDDESSDRTQLLDVISSRDLLVSSSAEVSGAAGADGSTVLSVNPTFNPGLNRPRIPRLDGVVTQRQEGDLVVLEVDGGPVSAAWLAAPRGVIQEEVTSAAAMGVPLISSGEDAEGWPVIPAGSDRNPLDVARDILKDSEAWLRASVSVRRIAHRLHASDVRGRELLTRVGIDVPTPWPTVGVLLVSNRPEELPKAITGVRSASYPRIHLVVGAHGFRPGRDLDRVVEEASSDLDAVSLLRFDSDLSLGACLNAAAERTGAQVLAKIDDDDSYGPGYLNDQVQALRYSGSEVVGKATQYVYLEEDDKTYLVAPGNEESFTTYVPGPTLVFRRRAWEASPFPHRRQRVDSIFL
ncbi:MAG: glycosyltransferase family A protein, partial [Vicinamibacteria bacterium]